MLQLNSTLCNSTIRNYGWSLWKLTTTMFNSSNTAVHPKATSITNSSEDNKEQNIQKSSEDNVTSSVKQLKTDSVNKKNILTKINHTKNVHDLIQLTKNPNLDSESISKIMSAINLQLKVQNEQAHKMLQTALARMISGEIKMGPSTTNILNQNLSQLSVPTIVKILKSFSLSRQRNVPVLKMLCLHITECASHLSIQTCGDILYCLAVLNYMDEQLVDKVADNVIKLIPNVNNIPIVSSIITSTGLLRYKNSKLLEAIVEWSHSNFKMLRCQDIAAFLQSFAACGYKSKSLDSLIKNCVYSLQKKDVPNVQEWLDIVWSLTILGNANPSHFASVLQETFIEQLLEKSQHSISKNLKLLNINGAAQLLLEDYTGPFLKKESKIFNTTLERGKQRHDIVNTLFETLTEIGDPSYFKTHVNTNMGFYIDVEGSIDSQNKLQPISNLENTQSKKVAIMIHDYHDYCRGEQDVLGVVQFHEKLLEAQEYKILTISYLNFSKEDKLEKRVKYLENQLNNIGITLT